MDKNCGTCKHWCDFHQMYDDPDEEDDWGLCQRIILQKEVTEITHVCQHYEVADMLKHLEAP